MAKLVFEKQTSGYKVRRAVKSEDGKHRWEELGRIVRENNYSKDYKPDVDIDGNVSSYYNRVTTANFTQRLTMLENWRKLCMNFSNHGSLCMQRTITNCYKERTISR